MIDRERNASLHRYGYKIGEKFSIGAHNYVATTDGYLDADTQRPPDEYGAAEI